MTGSTHNQGDNTSPGPQKRIEVARCQIGVDHDTIESVGQSRRLATGEAKTPVFGVIGSRIRYPIRMIG
jgi:hypothetical protein